MAVTWTENQQDAISARRGTVLVAAAAGSGKTAVLVQRALERLTDPEHPAAADQMLIVTFTKAAAAEMRARLEQRLSEMLRAQPHNTLLRRQSILLTQAHIGTVDSFCAEMVREFFQELNISPDFKIVSDKQKEDLTWGAMDQVLSEAFEENRLQELADAFAGERDDKKLAETVLRLYEFMQSHPFPKRWLREKAEQYETAGPIEATPWGQVILEYGRETAEHCLRVGETARREAEASGDEKLAAAYLPAILGDLALCEKTRELILSNNWDGVSRHLRELCFPRRGALRGYDGDPLKARLELLRTEVKGSLQDLSELFASDAAESQEELRKISPLVQGLAALTLAFSEKYEEKKKELGFLDYSDLEHLAIQLFLGEDGGPTPAAKEVAARFEEIMIDEYQDINEVQNSLFRAISRDGKNLFMVGDVKQSIYGFRRAMPEIFLKCKESFEKYDKLRDNYPAYLVLDRNFRSRSTVTDSVNFVFSRLMSKEAGDINYTGEEMLVCAAGYEEKPGCETEAVFLERESGIPAEEAESAYIAQRIQAMLAEGFTVSGKEGERPAQYGDFCILLRSANKYAHGYAQALQKLGIPAKASVSGGFFAAPEVAVMLSLLRVVDNPNQDIPLLSLLMSPIYGFTADDVARLRLEDREQPIYLALAQAAQTDGRCAEILQDIRQYRAVSATMASDTFVSFLYGKTGYLDMVLAMREGETRLSNLYLLQRYAREYEASGYHGVSGFVRFLERLRQSSSDLQAAEISGEGEQAVRVMSIHKSKGLEFPVCILAGCGRNFVAERSEVLLHPELGLGIKLRNPALSARFTTTAREAIALEAARSGAAEELRVLYVAMTRAKEKLIMLASGSGLEKSFAKLSAQITPEGVSPYAVRNVRNAGQWLALCALMHPNGRELRSLAGAEELPFCSEAGAPWHITYQVYQPSEAEKVEEEKENPAAADQAFYEALKRCMEFRYPYETHLDIPAKVSASKLTAAQAGEQGISLSRPAWLGEKGMTPAERGIALHDFMQYADFAAAAKDPAAELERLQRLRFLTPEQAQAVELSRVRKFFTGDLGKRVLKAEYLEKERRFTAEIPAEMAGEENCPDASVILQGAIDCVFLEGDKLHIIDFKTDKVKDLEELWQRYGTQIRLYAYAMEQVTGMKVGELFLYSTYLNQGSGKRYSKT